MRNLITIFRRELSGYFNSPIAVIFLIVFAVFSNGLFMMLFFQIGKLDMRPFFGSLPYTLNIFIPAIAMRLWAEDRRGGTFELLLTFPMRPHELVLGKYFASLLFFLVSLATTLTIPVMLSWSGPVDAGVIAGGYLGAALTGALFLAVGIFLSGLCRDQIVAFILTMVVTFALFFLGTDSFAVLIDGWLPGVGTFLKNHVGIASHLNGFATGIVDVRNGLYFVFLIAAFLLLNGLSLEGRFRPKAKWVFTGAVVTCVLSVVTLNFILHDVPLGRFDLTEGQMHKVSDVTKKILTGLKAPVQTTLYITPAENMPTTLKTLEQDIRDKVEEIRQASDGRFKFRVVHLETAAQDEEAQTKLRNEGVVPFQVESVQRDEVGVKLIYSTLVIEYKQNPQETLPRLLPANLADLEYQLMSRIYKMSLEKKPGIAVFAPLETVEMPEELGQGKKSYQDRYETAVVLMRSNGYEVDRIELTGESPIPESAGTLILFAPGELTDAQRSLINRFLYKGGTVMVAEQGYEFSYRRELEGVQAVPKKRPLGVNALIEKWGIKLSEQMLMDESSQVISLSSGQRIGPFAIEMPVKFPNQIIVPDSMINRSVWITKRVPSIAYLWGSSLELSESKLKELGLESNVLFTSSPRSWTQPYDGSSLTERNTQPPGQMKGKLPLAVLVQGQFTDTFGTEPAGEPKPGRLVVIGCAQAFSEDLLRTPGNLALFANLVDGLVLGEDLVQIRSKAAVTRDLKPFSNAEKLWIRFFTVLLVPIGLFMGALVRAFIRRKEKEFYLAAVKATGA